MREACRQRGLARLGGAIVGRFMLPTPQGLTALGLLEKSARASALLATGTHGRPWRLSGRAPSLVVPLAWRRSSRLACLGAAAGNDAWDGATAVSVAPAAVPERVAVSAARAMAVSALPDESGDAAVEGTDEGGDVATDDGDAAAPDAVSYLALSGDEHESNPTQVREPSRALAVVRLSPISLSIRHIRRASRLKPSSSRSGGSIPGRAGQGGALGHHPPRGAPIDRFVSCSATQGQVTRRRGSSRTNDGRRDRR